MRFWNPTHSVTLPGFRLMGGLSQKKIFDNIFDNIFENIWLILLSIHKKNKLSYRLILIDKACQRDNFSSLPRLPWRLIMCSILTLTPSNWTANRTIVFACNFTAYFISHFSQSESPDVHLMSLRQLSHDKCRSLVCVFRC